MKHLDPKTRRAIRVRAKIALKPGLPRLTVFRSNAHIWVQIIDDKHGKTIVSANSKTLELTKKLTKTEIASLVGQAIAKLALAKNIKHIRFDRGSYRYHGRVKALAQAARENGLKF